MCFGAFLVASQVPVDIFYLLFFQWGCRGAFIGSVSWGESAYDWLAQNDMFMRGLHSRTICLEALRTLSRKQEIIMQEAASQDALEFDVIPTREAFIVFFGHIWKTQVVKSWGRSFLLTGPILTLLCLPLLVLLPAGRSHQTSSVSAQEAYGADEVYGSDENDSSSRNSAHLMTRISWSIMPWLIAIPLMAMLIHSGVGSSFIAKQQWKYLKLLHQPQHYCVEKEGLRVQSAGTEVFHTWECCIEATFQQGLIIIKTQTRYFLYFPIDAVPDLSHLVNMLQRHVDEGNNLEAALLA